MNSFLEDANWIYILAGVISILKVPSVFVDSMCIVAASSSMGFYAALLEPHLRQVISLIKVSRLINYCSLTIFTVQPHWDVDECHVCPERRNVRCYCTIHRTTLRQRRFAQNAHHGGVHCHFYWLPPCWTRAFLWCYSVSQFLFFNFVF